jgi:hypothetical protein
MWLSETERASDGLFHLCCAVVLLRALGGGGGGGGKSLLPRV